MVFQLDTSLHPSLAPLAWLVGRWEGAGVVGYPDMESRNFGQEVVCSHDGRPFLEWQSHTWELDEAGNQVTPRATELGFWRCPTEGEAELLLAHNTGILELYYGTTAPAKVELQTDGVMRSPAARDYTAGARLYGLVNGSLMYAVDMAAEGHPLQSHFSAELKRVG